MVTLHICKWLELEGLGTLNTDIFWEEMPIDPTGKPIDGIWVVSRGAPLSRFNTTVQQFDIYSRYANKITGSLKLEAVLEKIKEMYTLVCELPQVPPESLTEYYNVRLRPVSGIENVGSDGQDKIVRVISAEVQYNKLEES
jgi:hypothetical protein